MWRLLVARVHPDQGGDGELFVWANAVREYAVGDAIEPPRIPRCTPTREGGPERIPYDPALEAEPTFGTLHRSLSVGRPVEEPFRSTLALLIDCGATDHGRRAERQMRGASYKQLALIAHSAGMSKAERVRWYDIARCIPLAGQHAHHIIGSLQRGEAA